MGRRINISTPTVINTELVPLDESFYLEYDGQLEQWYYDNTEQYAPNRKVTPLLLSPRISAFDKDTATSYSPTFATTQWYAKEWNEQQQKYVETLITNNVDSASADYVIQGNNLLVKKNVSYSHAVSIRCLATYIDPRDSGVTYTVEDSVNLTTNRTADVVFPEVDIISPSGRSFNPLVDDHTKVVDGETVQGSIFKFLGVKTNNPVQPLTTDIRRYGVDVDGTEEIVENGKGVAPIMDIRYGEYLLADQEFMYRQTAGGTLVGESIDKAYIEKIKGNTVAWNQMLNAISGGRCIRVNDNTISYNFSNASQFYNNVASFTTITNHKYFFAIKGFGDAVLRTSKEGDFEYMSQGDIYAGRTKIFVGTGVSSSLILTNETNRSGQGRIEFKCFDLTLIYGAGNEPTTVAQFEADYQRWFSKPLTYEPYDEGSLRPVLMQSVKTIGFNQWDEDWELGDIESSGGQNVESDSKIRSKKYIPVLPETVYYFKCYGDWTLEMRYYDSNKNYLGYKDYDEQPNAKNNTRKTPTDCCFVRFAIDSANSYNNGNICINISNQSKNGTYEPYEEKVQGFDVTAIKGKLIDGAGESVTIFPDGMKKAGNIQDEIFVEDGVIKAIKRVGSVNLGTLPWSKENDYTKGNSFFSTTSSKKSGNDVKGICSAYPFSSGSKEYYPVEKSFNFLTHRNIRNIYITDSAYTDAATFSAAMNGVMLYYELETPETYVLDPITDFVWYGIKDNQEVLADTLPWYVSGQGTDKLTVDAMYGEYINVVLRCKMMDGETLSPSKAYASLSWRVPDIESIVHSDNGGAVRSDTEEMTFGTIVNILGTNLDDDLKRKHLAFKWKIHKNNAAPNLPESEVYKGWGQRITIDASDLRNVKGSGSTLASTLVNNDVYLKGAYEGVTDNGVEVTDNGEPVYDRPID